MPPDEDPEGMGVIRAAGRTVVTELRDDIVELRADLVRLECAVDSAERLLGDLRQVTGRLEGEMRILVVAYERAAVLSSSQALADLEVRRTSELEVIGERSAGRKHRRELALKLAAGATGLWAILSALIGHGC